MAKSTTWATNLLKLLFTNVAAANIGDAGGLLPSASAGNLYVGLYNADPGLSDDQTTNETAYGGYARVAMPRSVGGWTVGSAQVKNAVLIAFPLCTGGSDTITHWGIGTDSAGAGTLLMSGALVSTWYPCTGELSNNRIHAPGSSFSVDDPIVFSAIEFDPMPGGITAGTVYYIKEAVVDPDAYHISTTIGGATLDITVDGTALVGKITPLAVSVNVAPAFAANALVWDEF